MPCNSSYLKATGDEVAFSHVACLLDELEGKEILKDCWDGYHPRIYSKRYDADAFVSELCQKLQNIDVSKQSLEMQIWWRDHQAADKKRLEEEIKKHNLESDKKAAIEKLSDHERKILNL